MVDGVSNEEQVKMVQRGDTQKIKMKKMNGKTRQISQKKKN